MGIGNIEVIMVNDCSKDNSGEIIDEYSSKYESFIPIHLEKNMGYAGGPRNVGLKHATGDYIMFLDPDDSYVEDACEVLYNIIIKNNADVAFGRFRRIFTYNGTTQKSYSPYMDNLSKYYPEEVFSDANHLHIPDFLWNNFIEKFLYGKNIEGKYKRNEEVDILYVDSLEEEPDLVKMRPSIWTKIIKRDLIMNNNIEFPKLISGEDSVFNLQVLLHAKGIVFLNNYLSYNYYVREDEENKSITHSVNSNFLNDLLDSIILGRKISGKSTKEIQNIIVNPNLLYWIANWKDSTLTKEENKIFLNKIKELESIHNGIKSKFILKTIKTMLKNKS